MNDGNIWPITPESYTIEGFIGFGGFAKVSRARCIQNNKVVAIKIIEMEDLKVPIEDIYKEIKTMSLCDHPNLVHYYTCFINKSDLWIIMPYLSLGSCHRVIEELETKKIPFKEEWISAIMYEVSKGLLYLHEKGIVHRDVKSSNILIDGNGCVKIADFGVAGIFDLTTKSNEKCKTFVGTPCWMAPEVIEHSRYSETSDVWSFGITLLELAKGYPPYAKEPPMKAMYLTLQSPPPSLLTYPTTSNFSTNFDECYKQCLVKNPVHRPSMLTISQTKFLSKSNNSCLKELSSLISELQLINLTDRKLKRISPNKSPDVNPINNYVPGTSWVLEVPENSDSDDIDFNKVAFGSS